MILAQTAETAKAIMEGVDKASLANDRWLFIATLVILLLFAGAVIKWLVASSVAKDTTHSSERALMDAEIKNEREESRKSRKEDQLAFLTELREIGTELRSLADSQKKNTEILLAHDKEMRDMHSSDLKVIVHDELLKLAQTKPTT